MDKAWIIWLIIGVVAFIIEASTVSLVSVWFGISAVIMAVLSLFIPSVFYIFPILHLPYLKR